MRGDGSTPPATNIPMARRAFARGRANDPVAPNFLDRGTIAHAPMGHYDGECTAINCKYTVTLTDLGNSAFSPDDYGKAQAMIRYLVLSRAYRWLGGRMAIFQAGFNVQDGTIWRTFESIDVDVPAHALRPEDEGYGLMAGRRADLR